VIRLAASLFFAQIGFHAFIASLPLALLAAGRDDAEIGAIMGIAALTMIPAGLVAGGLIDHLGGRAIFLVGTASFMLAAALLATGVVSPAGALAGLVLVRVLQGIGLATCQPSALSLVPGLVPAARLGTALAVVGVAANISLAVAPPVSLAILDASSLQVVAAVTLFCVAGAAWLTWPAAHADRASRAAIAGDRPRTFRPAWRSAWLAPLLISMLFVAHWGVVTGYLPQRAEAAGADVGLFFAADAVALLILRVPSGYLAGRFGSRGLILGGIGVTAIALALLLPEPTTAALIVAGLGTGAGGALILPPILLELSNRSTDAVRGSAFALFSVAFSLGIAAGSLGFVPIIETVGFEFALTCGLIALLAAGAITLADPSFRTERPLAAQGSA
jgi:MFS family permease